MTRTVTPLSLRRKLALTSALGMSLGVFAAPATAQVGPQGNFGSVTATANSTGALGTPTIVATPSDPIGAAGNLDTLTVGLNARNTIVDWSSFSVPANNNAAFNDTRVVGNGTPQAVLNRVASGNTTLGGGITSSANTQVWIINGNGIILGNNAVISTGGLVLSTLPMTTTDAAFLAFNGTYSPAFAGAAGATAGITTVGGGAQVYTRGGLLALIAPVIAVNGTFSGGNQTNPQPATLGQVAFVTAEDMSFTSTPGSPLAFTINRGTSVAGSSTIAGSVSGDRVYAIMSAQNGVSALLGVTATVNAATVTGNGVVVLGGKANIAGSNVAFTADGTTLPPGALLADNTGTVGTTVGAITDTGGTVLLSGNGTLTGTGAIITGTLNALDVGAVTLNNAGNQVGTLQIESTTGAASFTNGIALAVAGSAFALTDLTITNTGLLTVNAGAQAQTGNLSLTGDGISLTTSATAGGDASLDARLGTLDVTAGNTVNVGGSYAARGATFANAALAPTFTGAATHNFTITDTDGGLSVGALTAPDTLTITTLAGGTLTTTGLLTSTNAAVNLTGAGGISLGANVQSATSQSYTGTVTLAADVTLTSSGSATTGGITFNNAVTGAQALTVATAGLTTFGGVVGATPLTSLTVNNGPTSAAANISTSGAQSYTGQFRLAGPVTLAGTTGTFTGGILGNTNNLALNFTAPTTLTTVTGVNNLAIGGGSTTTLGGTISTTGTQTYTDGLILNAATTLTSSGAAAAGNIGLAGITGAGNTLAVNTTGGGTTTFNGNATNLGSLTTDTPGLTVINTASLSTAGSNGPQTFNDAVRLDATTTLDAGSSSITFNGTVVSLNEAQGLTTSGTTNFNADVGGIAGGNVRLASLTTQSGTVLGGPGIRSIRTLGAQSYGATAGGLVLNTDAVLTGTGGTFSQAITGNNHDLTLNFSGPTAISGTSFSNVKNFTTGGGGTTTITGTVSTNETQTYNDAVVLSGASVGVTSSGAGAAGNITFANTLNSTVLPATASALTVNTAGTLIFAGVVGGTAPLASISAAAPGSITPPAQVQIQANVTTNGAQNYAPVLLNGATAVTLDAGAGNVTLGGLTGVVGAERALTINSTGATTINGNNGAAVLSITTNAGGNTTLRNQINTLQDQTYNDAVTLGAATALTARRAIFTGGVTGAGSNLTLTVSGTGANAQVLGATITGVQDLTTNGTGELSLSGAITTTGNQSFSNPITLTAGTTLSASGAGKTITFVGPTATINGSFGLQTSASQTNFNANVGQTPGAALASLQVTGIATTGGTGPRLITTTGSQQYGGQLQLNTNTVLTGTGAGASGIFSGGVLGNGNDLTLSFPVTTAIGPPFTGIDDLIVNGPASLSGTISAGTQTYNGATTVVGTGAVLLSSATIGNNGIVFGTASTLNGTQPLTITTAGNTVLGGVIGNTAPGLGSLTVNGTGAVLFNNGNVTTSGSQSYAGPATLNAATTLTSSVTAPANAVTFLGTVNGAQTLIVTAPGTTVFGGVVGGTTPLTSLAVTNGATQLNTGALTTTGNQTYTGQLRLSTATVLTGTNITPAAAFTATGGVLGGGNDLTLNFAGTTNIGGGFGGIDDLIVNGPASLAGTISAGSQTYNGAVTLTGGPTAVVLQSNGGTGAGAIVFGSAGTINGNVPLVIQTTGTTALGGQIGGTSPIALLAVGAVGNTGNILFNDGRITTVGAQTYNGPVTLAVTNKLVTTGGNVTFANTVDSGLLGTPSTLSVQTGAATPPGSGTVAFNGLLGSIKPLAGLAIRAASATTTGTTNQVGNIAALIATGGFSYTDAAALAVFVVDGLGGITIGTGTATIAAGGGIGTAGGRLTLNTNITATGAVLTGTGVTQTGGQTVNVGAGTIAVDGNDDTLLFSGTLTTTNATANAVRLIDASTASLSTINAGAGTVTLGGAGLDNIAGAVTQNGATIITAGTLAGAIGGAATLTNANAVGTVAGFGADSLAFVNANALAIGTLPAPAGSVTITNGLALTTNAGGMTFGGNVSAASATLTSAATIGQTGGAVTFGSLTGTSVGGTALTQSGNSVGTLAGFTNTGGGGFQLADIAALTITQTVDGGTGPLTINSTATTVPGIAAIFFDGVSLSTTGNVTLTATDGISGLSGGSVSGAVVSIGGGTFANISGVGGSSISVGGGTVFVGTGTASTGMATLTAGNGVTVGTLLSGQTGASATTTNGLADVTEIKSQTGLVQVRGGTADIDIATAVGGQLDLRSTNGSLRLGQGSAGDTATLVATGTTSGGVNSGAITVDGALGATNNIALTATGAIDTTAVPNIASTNGAIDFKTTQLGDIKFFRLTAPGTKTISAQGGIQGAALLGTGADVLTALATSPIVITSSIGTTAARAASVTINGGSAVTLGTIQPTAVATSGAVSIGQGPGAVVGALTVNGTIDAGTAIAATATGLVDLDNLIAGTTVSVISNADAVNFDTLTAPGATTLTSTVFKAALGLTGNSVDAGGTLQLAAGTASPLTIGAIDVTKPATSLTVNGGSTLTLGTVAGAGTTTVNVNGNTRIGQLADGAATGVLVVNGNVVNTGTFTSTTTGATTFADVTSTGVLAVTTGAGNATFATLKGAGAKSVTSGQGIVGTAIQGAGAVTLIAATTSPITIGSIGVALPTAAPVASLTINGGNVVTIGTTGSTATNLVVGGATSIGQGPGAATGSLIVNGPLTTGTLTSTTSGSTTVNDVAATGAAAITATGGNIGYTTIGAGSIALNASGTVTGGVLTSGAAVGVTSGGATTITGGTSGGTGNFTVAATGAATVSGAVTAGGGYSVRGSSVSLGTGATAQSAKGLVDVTSTNGALTASNGLVLSSNTDGAGTEYLVLDATGGPIAFGNATLNGGIAANRSDVGVLERTAGQAVTLGTVNARSLAGANAARTTFGVLTNAGDIVETGPITVQQTLALTSTGGLITLNTVDVTGAGQGIALITSAPGGGAVSASRLTATNGAVSIDARGAVTVPTIATTTGGVGATSGSIRGASVDLGTVNVGGGTLGVTSTAGQLRVNTVTSGTTTLDATGALEVTNTLTTTGLTTIKSTGNSALRQVRVTGAALDVNATGSVSGLTTARADLAAAGAGGNVTVKAGTSALLGPIGSSGNAALTAATSLDVSTTTASGSVAMTGGAIAAGATTAGTSVTMTGSGITTTGLTTTGTTLTVTSTGAISMSPGANVGTDAAFDAGTLVTLGQVIAGTSSGITIKALDADITGTQRAARVTFTNRTPATNTIKLGTGVSSGAGFLLTTTEVNNVEAGQLTIDGGTGNIEIGQLGFDADAGRTRVDVLATGRIDVSGAVSGAGAGRTFRFGGTTANTTDKAAVIRIVATPGTAPSSPSSATNVPTDAGGRLLFDADLDLRGGRIGAGLLTSFLDPIGFGPGQTALTAATVGADFVGNPNSALYNSTYGPGGIVYNNPTLLTARSLTVRYTDYALIQNTGTPGVNTGVVLGSMASPSTPALVVQAQGSTVNAFALFGSINGITDTGAAVSGSSVIQVSGADLGNTRINGCLAGSGAGCLSSVVSQPLLNIFDSSRLAVFRAADDLALPFDPVVGTNNEALFSGFGLIDSPVTDTECSTDTTNPACGQNKEQAK